MGISEESILGDKDDIGWFEAIGGKAAAKEFDIQSRAMSGNPDGRGQSQAAMLQVYSIFGLAVFGYVLVGYVGCRRRS